MLLGFRVRECVYIALFPCAGRESIKQSISSSHTILSTYQKSLTIHAFFESTITIHNNLSSFNMVAQTSKPTSRSSSVTAPVGRSDSLSQGHVLSTSSLRSALKKPFQGWSKELLRARDNDDDDYNFSSGMRRGAQLHSDNA